MSQYDKLDFLIVEAIKSGARTFLWIDAGEVRKESQRLHEEDRKLRPNSATSPFGFIDKRLQTLRKRGLIEHRKDGDGWVLKGAA